MLKGLVKPSGNSYWIEIMDKIIEVFPFLMNGRGRPSDDDLQGTHIAAVGASSWKEYVIVYLEWKYDTWNNWRKAYAIVLKHRYLRFNDLTVGTIMSMKRWCKANQVSFPPDSEQWEQNRLRMKGKPGTSKKFDDTADSKYDSKHNLCTNQEGLESTIKNPASVEFVKKAMQLDYTYSVGDWMLGKQNNRELYRQNVIIFEKNCRLRKENNHLIYKISCMSKKLDKQDRLLDDVIKGLLDMGLTKHAHTIKILKKSA